ncbi:hypothetical protein IU500_10525 [Nocardia terpenica]|uniref:hypothetical protein n=1 Tax=Nocardia terpenica TaxID=455432 RepID=UPI001892E0BB|nr:hypothetical protein [Nocardia terpenica]MBF6062387.1 hypothetical protein [Nocardia terpenica]MBF6104475.1 hypothetical protein [Nocardia terpenica]MBF6119975.1 hypothetical protein [Nocardia terpenica]MBF6152386.1 hypothetical protein [Nocardia terpenica]
MKHALIIGVGIAGTATAMALRKARTDRLWPRRSRLPEPSISMVRRSWLVDHHIDWDTPVSGSA